MGKIQNIIDSNLDNSQITTKFLPMVSLAVSKSLL